MLEISSKLHEMVSYGQIMSLHPHLELKLNISCGFLGPHFLQMEIFLKSLVYDNEIGSHYKNKHDDVLYQQHHWKMNLYFYVNHNKILRLNLRSTSIKRNTVRSIKAVEKLRNTFLEIRYKFKLFSRSLKWKTTAICLHFLIDQTYH